MAKSGKNKRILWTDPHLSMRILGVVAGCFAFAATYLTLMSALTQAAATIYAVFTGVVVAAVYLMFAKKRFIWLVVLGISVIYTAVCVAVGFNLFLGGAANFINRIVAVSNQNMHWGFASIRGIEVTPAGDFLFCSVLSVWLGFGSAAICRKGGIWYVLPVLLLVILWLCLGLIPAAYAVFLLVLSLLIILEFEHGFTVKAAICYVCVAVLVFGAVAPTLLYDGSKVVKSFKSGASEKIQELLYGADDLPGGKLAFSSGMRASRDVRLNVTLAGDIRNLYLRGYVGSELNGNRWQSTDKNVYVSDGYQGMLEYVAAENIPFMQYSRYAQLNSQRNNIYPVIVENVSANRQYMYVPYTLSSVEQGYGNYDMNILGNVFTSKTYSYTVFAGDRSYEGLSQAQWLTNSAQQTQEMRSYVAYEEQYRKFVHDTYGVLDETQAAIVKNALNVTNINESINPATNIIRNYFNTKFLYSDKADSVGNDFISDFFGGKIKIANAAYFASAAVLAFRMYGYAARYVEGYLVYADEGEQYISVTGNFSHAWVEVYFDGVGWLPIEVTPGFYKDMHEINPDDPEDPEVPPEPIKPPEDDEPPEPSQPEKPPEKPEQPLTDEERKLYNALKILLPVACAVLAVLLIALTFVLRYTLVKRKKRRSLECNGEAFGRAAYTIIENDCKIIGGFTPENLEDIGVSAKLTERFGQIIEHCVYGGYDLNANERNFVLRYIDNIADSIACRGSKWHKFVCKYIKCIGV